MNEIGNIIYKRRKILGLSQEDLAEKIGVSRQTIYKWESNVVQPNSENINVLCDALGIDKEEFYKDDVGLYKSESIQNETAMTLYKHKRFFIGLVINSIFLSLMFLATIFLGLMTFSSNTGDAQATSNNFGYEVFIAVLCLFIVDLVIEVILIILMKRNK